MLCVFDCHKVVFGSTFGGGAGRAAKGFAGFGEAQGSMAGHGLMFGDQNAFFLIAVPQTNVKSKVLEDFREINVGR